MTLWGKMTLAEEIALDLANLTQHDLDIAASDLNPPAKGETILCVIEDEYTRRMWALGFRYKRLSVAAENDAAFQVTDKAAKEHLRERARRYESLSQHARATAWIGCTDIANHWKPGNLGIRENYTLVLLPETAEDDPPFPLSPETVTRALGRLFGVQDLEPQPADPSKPERKPS